MPLFEDSATRATLQHAVEVFNSQAYLLIGGLSRSITIEGVTLHIMPIKRKIVTAKYEGAIPKEIVTYQASISTPTNRHVDLLELGVYGNFIGWYSCTPRGQYEQFSMYAGETQQLYLRVKNMWSEEENRIVHVNSELKNLYVGDPKVSYITIAFPKNVPTEDRLIAVCKISPRHRTSRSGITLFTVGLGPAVVSLRQKQGEPPLVMRQAQPLIKGQVHYRNLPTGVYQILIEPTE